LISTLPAIATSLIGILVGVWLRTPRAPAERCAGVLVFGLLTLLLGLAMNRWYMPINKNIWTPSFTVFTAAMGMLCLGTTFYIADVLGRRRWALPFVIYGMNAIAAFVAAGLVVRIALIIKLPRGDEGQRISLITYVQNAAAGAVDQAGKWLQQVSPHFFNIATPQNESLAYAILFVLAILLLMSVMYVMRIFVKV
jgi:predicted acyltransferase